MMCLVLFLILFLGRRGGAQDVPSRDALLTYAGKCTGMHEAEEIVLYCDRGFERRDCCEDEQRNISHFVTHCHTHIHVNDE